MRVVLGAVLAFIIGFAAVYAAVVAGGLWYVHANRIPDRDGGMSMAIMFAFGPLAGLLGGIIAAVATGAWLSRRERARQAAGLPPTPWPVAALLIGALLAGTCVYFGAWGLIGMFGPRSYPSYGAALAVSLTPIALGLATAGLIAWRALSRASGSTATDGKSGP